MTRAILLAALFATACDLTAELEGEPCGTDRDCTHKQQCARTDDERAAGLPGVCADKGTDCIAGEQLGCSCEPEDPSVSCSTPALSSTVEYPEMACDPTANVCVLATEVETEG